VLDDEFLLALDTGTVSLPRDGGEAGCLAVLRESSPRDANEVAEQLQRPHEYDADNDDAPPPVQQTDVDDGGLRAPTLPERPFQSLFECPLAAFSALYGGGADERDRTFRLEAAGVEIHAHAAEAKWSATVHTCKGCFSALKSILKQKDPLKRIPDPSFVSWFDFGKAPRDEEGLLPQLTYVEGLCVAPAFARRQMLLLIPGKGTSAAGERGTDGSESIQRGMRGHVIANQSPDPAGLASLSLPLSLGKLAERLTVRLV
jgi:hypothetical protein